ncbi:MAG: ACT domain-containing protein [Acidobacteria bacterium]|nr:ACT domain-containing protein [Acidobacteriota bacterium]
MHLTILPGQLAICRRPADTSLPADLDRGPFFAYIRTPEELSIILPVENTPPDWQCERGWCGIKVAGPLDFSLVGVLHSLTAPLAQAGISLFAVSTFDTDYILVRRQDLDHARDVLSAAGHVIQ